MPSFETSFREVQEPEVPARALEEKVKASQVMASDLSAENNLAGLVKAIEESKTHEGGKNSFDDEMWKALEVLPKIDSKNYKNITEQVIKSLNAEGDEKQAAVEKIEALAHISRGLEKIGMLDEEGKKITYRMLAIEDAAWMQRMGNRIKSIKENKDILEEDKQKKIESIWRSVKEIYRNYGKYYEDFKSDSRGYNIGDYDGTKNGVRGQRAAELQCSEMGKLIKKLNLGNVEVLPSTPEEDVDLQTDFYLKIQYGNGFEREFPCQVKAKLYDSRSAKFIIENMVVVIDNEPKDLEKILKDDCDRVREVKEGMAKFRDKALAGKFKKGIFIIVPYGSATLDKGKKKKEFKLLSDDGEAADYVKDVFIEQFGKYVYGVDNLKERAMIKSSKKGGKKK